MQTSGRSLHAQEMDFNDIRTTLQALIAIYDNVNSLHTNAFNEAVTTPSEESVRRALAIQMIINREWGLAMNENPLQGSSSTSSPTRSLRRCSRSSTGSASAAGSWARWRPGTSAAGSRTSRCSTSTRKHDGSLPIIGVNTFRRKDAGGTPDHVELARATEAEKQSQLTRVRAYQDRRNV